MKSRRAACAIALIGICAIGAALVTAAGVLYRDPPLNSHCACNGRGCPLDAYGRRCSCGCSVKVVVDQAENVGFYDWTGAGDVTTQAKIRVTSIARPELSQMSPAFSISIR